MINYKKIISFVTLGTLIFSQTPSLYAMNDAEIVTKADISVVEGEVLSLQKQLSQAINASVTEFAGEFKKFTEYKESGNYSLTMELDENNIGTAKANMNLKNYEVKTKNFDSEVSAQFDLQANYQPLFASGFEIDAKGFASLISKDSQMYALLKDLDFKVNDKNLAAIVDQVKEQFQDNTYVKLPSDEQSKQAIEILKNITPSELTSQTDSLLSQPLFTTYKKDGNKYYLIPSKYACNAYFELDKKLNFSNPWYTPETCTESVYKKVVKDFIKNGKWYLIVNATGNNELGYEFIDATDKTEIKLSVWYTKDAVNEVTFDIIPDQVKYNKEKLNIHFKNAQYLNATLYAEKGLFKGDFASQLDKNNNFTQIQSTFNFAKDVMGNISLKDKKLSSFVMIKQKGYDYDSDDWEYKLKNVFALKTTGTMDSENTLSSLNIKFAGVDVNTKKAFLLGKVTLQNNDFTTFVKVQNDMTQFQLNGKGTLEDKYFNFDSSFVFNTDYKGNFALSVDQRNDINNLQLKVGVNNAGKDIFKLNVENKAKRTYSDDIEIKAPTNFKEISSPSSDYNEDYLDEFEELDN